jgi:hypothetical protein
MTGVDWPGTEERENAKNRILPFFSFFGIVGVRANVFQVIKPVNINDPAVHFCSGYVCRNVGMRHDASLLEGAQQPKEYSSFVKIIHNFLCLRITPP